MARVQAESWQCRSAATGEQKMMLDEAHKRLEAASANLSHAAVGNTDPGDVLLGSIRLIAAAERLIFAATDHETPA